MGATTVDFIAFDDHRNVCLLVLVEEAQGDVSETCLHSLQDRLYGCLEAALDGEVATRFPRSIGMDFVIQIDCYGLSNAPVDTFIENFAAGVSKMADYSPERSNYVRSFRFEVNHAALPT